MDPPVFIHFSHVQGHTSVVACVSKQKAHTLYLVEMNFSKVSQYVPVSLPFTTTRQTAAKGEFPSQRTFAALRPVVDITR